MRARGSSLLAAASSTRVERCTAGRVFALLVNFPVALLGLLGCGVASWVSVRSIARVSSLPVISSLVVRAMRGRWHWRSKGLCGVGSGVPLGFGLPVCHAGMLGVPLLRSMRASYIARAVTMGWCLCSRLGCPEPGGGTCVICGTLRWPLSVRGGGIPSAVPPVPVASYSVTSRWWRLSGPPSADMTSLGYLGL